MLVVDDHGTTPRLAGRLKPCRGTSFSARYIGCMHVLDDLFPVSASQGRASEWSHVTFGLLLSGATVGGVVSLL